MKTRFKKSFLKDLKRHKKDKKLFSRIREKIKEVEAAENIFQIRNIKKLQDTDDHYRIRIGSYRIGLIIGKEEILFIRLLGREEIYKHFP